MARITSGRWRVDHVVLSCPHSESVVVESEAGGSWAVHARVYLTPPPGGAKRGSHTEVHSSPRTLLGDLLATGVPFDVIEALAASSQS